MNEYCDLFPYWYRILSPEIKIYLYLIVQYWICSAENPVSCDHVRNEECFVKYIALLFVLMIPTIATAETVPYCDDPVVIKDWQSIAIENRHSDGFQRLHAVWLGLCEKVRNGNLTQNRADRMFEEERTRTIHLEELKYVDPAHPFG